MAGVVPTDCPQMTLVSQQYDAFLAALPELLRTHAGKWAVYFDGVQALLATEDEAMAWAFSNFGNSPFVIAPVKEASPVLLSAALVYCQSKP